MKNQNWGIRRKSVLALGLCFLLSCAEFSNQSKPSGAPPETKSPGPVSENAFPAGFDPNQGEFSESKMIANIGLNVIAPATSRFRLQSELFLAEVESLFGRLSAGQDAANELESTQNAWRTVMASFHFLEGVPVGPLSDKKLGLKDRIYAWPAGNYCGIDKEVVLRSEDASLPVPKLFTVKGLVALEYLLFEDDLGSQCNPMNPQNKKMIEWTRKPALAKVLDRTRYAVVLAKDLVEQARELETAWAPTGANFSKTLVDGTLYPSIKDATTAVSDALFSLEVLKEKRLALPLGLHKECLNEDKKCPEEMEHKWSRFSFEAMEAQMKGFEAAFYGRSKTSEGFGFDDFLKGMGRADVVEHLGAAVTAFYDQVQRVKAQGTMGELIHMMDAQQCQTTTLQTPNVPVCVLYQNVRQVTSKLKTEFLTALSLRSPPIYQGDSD